MSAYGRPAMEQARMNARKVAMRAIRLKHTLAGDNELNEVMPILDAALAKMVQEGRTPMLTMSAIEDIIYGEEE